MEEEEEEEEEQIIHDSVLHRWQPNGWPLYNYNNGQPMNHRLASNYLKGIGVTSKTYLIGASNGTGSQWIATLDLKVGIGHHTTQTGRAVNEELRQSGYGHRSDMDK